MAVNIFLYRPSHQILTFRFGAILPAAAASFTANIKNTERKIRRTLIGWWQLVGILYRHSSMILIVRPIIFVVQDYSLSMYLRQSWLDTRLKFNRFENNNNSILKLEDGAWNSLWVPDIYFRNEKQTILHGITRPNRMMRILENGEIWYVMKWVCERHDVIMTYNGLRF